MVHRSVITVWQINGRFFGEQLSYWSWGGVQWMGFRMSNIPSNCTAALVLGITSNKKHALGVGCEAGVEIDR